ncbi:hypothetical protein EDB83DRAFT_2519859 [Lactarius deliciosus]|nr:hypothetical protein EDB83DRAFT_2519859 [Lactarius deliciosus]
MDIDTVMTRFTLLTPAERDQCQREGRCFYCRQIGHSYLICPKKAARFGTMTVPGAQTNTIAVTAPPPPAVINAASVHAHLLNLNARERGAILQTLMLMDGSDLGSDDGATYINAVDLDFTPCTPRHSPPSSPTFPAFHWFHPSPAPTRPTSPVSVVEDDNMLTRGVKTLDDSVFSTLVDNIPVPDMTRSTPEAITRDLPEDKDEDNDIFYDCKDPTPSIEDTANLLTDNEDDFNPKVSHNNEDDVVTQSRYVIVFPTHAFERPRDPDEVALQTSAQPRRHRANAVVVPSPPAPTPVDTCSQQNDTRPNASTADHIHRWLTAIIYDPPPCHDSHPAQPRPPIDLIAERRADHALRDYEYEYEDAYKTD